MRGIALILGLAVNLTAIAAARADVIDHASIFSPDAVAKAKKTIADLESKHQQKVTIETFPEIPGDKQAEFERVRNDPAGRDRFYVRWADDRLNANGGGVMVLISMKPGHVHIRADRDAASHGFTDRSRSTLKSKFAGLLGEKKYDEALAAGVSFVSEQFAAKHSAIRPAELQPVEHPRRGIMDWLCPIIAIVIGVWIVIALIRAITGAGRRMIGGPGPMGGPAGGFGGGYGPGYGGGFGGGGFFSNFLGGMFGAAAGNWMYDSFFGGRHSGGSGGGLGGGFGGGSAFGADPGVGNDPDYGRDSGDTGGADFGGDTGGGGFVDAGGDFGGGSDFGGGDFGGGDFGGGDFGGGDFGGGDFGGGDFGGGDAGGDY